MADSKELQTQLQINQQINKLLADRSKTMQGLQSQLTSQTQLAAELCKALECQDIEGMTDRLEEINKGFKDAAASAQEFGSAQAAAGKKTEKSLKNNREEAGGFLDKLSSMKAAAVAGGAGLMKAFSGGLGMFKMLAGGALDIVKNVGKLGMAVAAVPFKMIGGFIDMAAAGSGGTDELRQAMEELKGEMGDLAKGEGKAVMDGFNNLKSSTGALAQSGLNMRNVFGAGKAGAAAALKAVGEMAKAAGASFSMMKDQLSDAADAGIMLNKGLGMSNEALAEMARKAHNSGTSARDAMIETASMAIQMGDEFGVSAKTVGKNMSDMTMDVENFGTMSKKQLAATATYMAKLGLEAKDLQGVIDKFDDFEGAAESVSHLNQAFGIQLDTMEMMNAQNPAERIDMMKNAFHEAGKSVEDMTRAEKKLMAEQMGLSVSAMENVLATENMDVAYEDMEAAAEDAEANKMSEKEVMLELAKSVQKLVEGGDGVSGFFDAFKKGFGKGFAQAEGFQEMLGAIRQSLKVVYDFGKKMGKMFGDLLGKMGLFKSIKKIFDPKAFKELFGSITKHFQKFFDALTGKGDYSAAQLFEDISKDFAKFFGGKAGEGLKGLKTFFIKMIDIAGDILASALPWIIEKLAGLIEGIANFLADPSAAMNAAGKATDGIGGAFVKAFSKIGKALKPALPKLWAALKKLFGELWKIIKPWLFKAFIAIIAISAAKGIAVGLIKAAGTGMIMGAIKLMAKKMGMASGKATQKEMKKGQSKAVKKQGSFFKAMGKAIKRIGNINKKDIIKAGITLGLLAVMFSGVMVAFAIGFRLAYEVLKTVSWSGAAKVLAVVAASMLGTYLIVKFAQKINPGAVLKAIPALVASAGLFAVGMVAFAGAVWIADKILKKIKWSDFTKMMKIIGISLLATAGLAVAGAAMAAFIPLVPAMIVGLGVAAGLFTAGIVIFAIALKKSMPQFKEISKNKTTIDQSIDSIIKMMKTIAGMGVLGTVFAAIGLFVFILKKGFAIAADFFIDVLSDIKRMIKSIMAIPMANPDDVGKRIFIIAKIADAMQAISKIGLDAAKMGMVSELLGGTSMPDMMKAMGGFIKDVAGSLAMLISLVVGLASGLDPNQRENVKVVSAVIGAVANLASALFKPLETVAKLSSSMFGPDVTEVMDAVVKGLESLMAKVEKLLPSLVKKLIKIAKGIKDPKTLKPKMEIVSTALRAVADFSSAIGTVAKLIPSGKTAWYKKDKDMGERLKEMSSMITQIVSVVQTHIGTLVRTMTQMNIGGKPEEIGPKIKVISDAMNGVAKFAQVIDGIKKLSMEGIDAGTLVGHVIGGIINVIGGPGSGEAGSQSISSLFDALSNFNPDMSQLCKLENASKTVSGITDFTAKVVQLKSTLGDGAGLTEAVTCLVETAKAAITSLNSIGELNAEVALENFAQAIGTGDGKFTVSNEPINITMNVRVVMNADKVGEVLVDKSVMTTPLATAEG